jgi:hypothetical protein
LGIMSRKSDDRLGDKLGRTISVIVGDYVRDDGQLGHRLGNKHWQVRVKISGFQQVLLGNTFGRGYLFTQRIPRTILPLYR